MLIQFFLKKSHPLFRTFLDSSDLVFQGFRTLFGGGRFGFRGSDFKDFFKDSDFFGFSFWILDFFFGFHELDTTLMSRAIDWLYSQLPIRLSEQFLRFMPFADANMEATRNLFSSFSLLLRVFLNL